MNIDALIRKCRHCKEPAGSTGRCVKHNEAHKADQRRRIAERKAAGLCQCGREPIAELTLCLVCQSRNKSIQLRKRATGSCLRCAVGNKAVAAGMCRKCWFKKVASDGLKQRGQAMRVAADMLELLWEKQRGLCALTGESLIMGESASIDHIVPQSRGGDHSADNLQWVSLRVNQAKNNLTQDEFIALCGRVVSHKEKV